MTEKESKPTSEKVEDSETDVTDDTEVVEDLGGGTTDTGEGSPHKSAESLEELSKLLSEAQRRIDQELKQLIETDRSRTQEIKQRCRKLKERIASLSRAQGEGKTIENIPQPDNLQTYGRLDFRSIEIGFRNSERRLSPMTNTYLQTARSYARKTRNFNELLQKTLGEEQIQSDPQEETEEIEENQETGDEEELENESYMPSFTMEAKTSSETDEDPSDDVEEEEGTDESGEDEGSEDKETDDPSTGDYDKRLLNLLNINRDHFHTDLADIAKWSNEFIEPHINAPLPGGYVIKRDGKRPTPLISRDRAYGTPQSTSSKLPSVARLRRLVNTLESTASHIESQSESVQKTGEELKQLIEQTRSCLEEVNQSPTGKVFLSETKNLAVYRYIRGKFVARINEIHQYQFTTMQAALEYTEHCLSHYGSGRMQDQIQ